MMRERPIGQVFKLRGVNVVVVPDVKGIDNCRFCLAHRESESSGCLISDVGPCLGSSRYDRVDVHFERFNGGEHLTRHFDGDKKSPIKKGGE